MRRYETFIIIDPDLSDEERSPIFEKVKDLIQQEECLLVTLDEWGARRLAYEIKKKSRGYYVCLDYCGTGKLVDEMERFFRIDDRVMKYMTVLLDKYADIELIKEEMANAEVKETEPDQHEADIELSAPDINDSETETAEDETTKTTESE
jgi:small subunit ribosomal protein S6